MFAVFPRASVLESLGFSFKLDLPMKEQWPVGVSSSIESTLFFPTLFPVQISVRKLPICKNLDVRSHTSDDGRYGLLAVVVDREGCLASWCLLGLNSQAAWFYPCQALQSGFGLVFRCEGQLFMWKHVTGSWPWHNQHFLLSLHGCSWSTTPDVNPKLLMGLIKSKLPVKVLVCYLEKKQNSQAYLPFLHKRLKLT